MDLILPGISKANLDCSIGSNLPGNSLVTEYSLSILTSKTSKAETEELKEMLIKIRFIYFERFIFILFLLTLILKEINVCSVNILTKMYAVSTLLTINVIIV
jgi:hypothetical protein